MSSKKLAWGSRWSSTNPVIWSRICRCISPDNVGLSSLWITPVHVADRCGGYDQRLSRAAARLAMNSLAMSCSGPWFFFLCTAVLQRYLNGIASRLSQRCASCQCTVYTAWKDCAFLKLGAPRRAGCVRLRKTSVGICVATSRKYGARGLQPASSCNTLAAGLEPGRFAQTSRTHDHLSTWR